MQRISQMTAGERVQNCVHNDLKRSSELETLIRLVRQIRYHPDNHQRTGQAERPLVVSVEARPSGRSLDGPRVDSGRYQATLYVTRLPPVGFGRIEPSPLVLS
jgi:hypothetical protein